MMVFGNEIIIWQILNISPIANSRVFLFSWSLNSDYLTLDLDVFITVKMEIKMGKLSLNDSQICSIHILYYLYISPVHLV